MNTTLTDPLIHEKIAQSGKILQETGIDLWLTFVRESAALHDPALDFIYGHDVTWQSAFILTRSGERIAIVGHYDAETAQRTEAYHEVIPYHEAFSQPLLAVLQRLQPQQIAINYSSNDCHADGLTFGMYQLLTRYLADTPFAQRLLSAEPILNALRGRKTPSEVERIQAAIRTTLDIYRRTFDYAQIGMSERQIGRLMSDEVQRLGLTTAWEAASCPAVNSGPDSPLGHAGPTDLTVQPGHLLHFDFGIKQNDYCSDIQRMLYFLHPGEDAPPPPVQRAFACVVAAVQAAVTALKPGVCGHEVDGAARQVVIAAGYPEYKWATGHQLGRACHDGGALLGPLWEKYGESPKQRVEAGHVYTIEPGVILPGYGYIGLEEDVLITDDGAIYLHEPQTRLISK
jgi:Xaa-Pro aminopeptidase